MKALILNSGMGSRMGEETKTHPKCMTKLKGEDTILSRQLRQLCECGVKDIVITTGYFDEILIRYCNELNLNLNYTFVNNSLYKTTNYIYSIYLALKELQTDILMMHGDLVFDIDFLHDILNTKRSSVAVDINAPLPEKDFKAVIRNEKVEKIGINFFEQAVAAQPLYKLDYSDWKHWAKAIETFCMDGQVQCYAENALNTVTDKCELYPLDVENKLCREIDTLKDWDEVCNLL